MTVNKESIDCNDMDNEEEEEDKKGEMEDEDMSVMRLELPLGRHEHHKLKEHTICLAYCTNMDGCF